MEDKAFSVLRLESCRARKRGSIALVVMVGTHSLLLAAIQISLKLKYGKQHTNMAYFLSQK